MSKDRRVWSPFLICLLVMPTALAIAGVVPNDVRVDSVAAPPELELARLFDAEQYRLFDDGLAQRFPGRGIGSWAEVKIDYGVFGEVANPDLMRGPGRWLHRVANVNPSCDALAAIGSRSVPEELDDRVVFVVIPPKNYIHPEGVDAADIDACVVRERASWLERTRDEPEYLDVTAALGSVARSTGELLYYEEDSHWTQQGRLVVAERLVDRLSPGTWSRASVVSSERTVRDMDLLHGMGLKQSGTLSDRTVVLDGDVTIETISSVTSGSAYFPLVQISRSSATDRIPGITMMVGDSQLGYLLLELAPFFEELVFVNWVQQFLDIGPLQNLPAPDRLLFSAVEGNAAGLFASEFVDTTLDRLAPAGS